MYLCGGMCICRSISSGYNKDRPMAVFVKDGLSVAIAEEARWGRLQELRLALDQLVETTIESYQYDLLNRKVTMRCVNGSTNASYAVVIFGVVLCAGVDESGDRFDASEDLPGGYLECSDIFVPKDQDAFVARISCPRKIGEPNAPIAANLIIDIWGCTFLYIRAKGISIDGREFLL